MLFLEATRPSVLNLPRLGEKLKAFQQLIKTARCERADLLRQIALVHCEDLRDFDDAFLGQACFSFVQLNIAGSLGSLQIRSQGANDHRIDSASIEEIALNHHVRMPITGFGARRLLQGNPEHIALIDYHWSFTIPRCRSRIIERGDSSFSSGMSS